MAIRTVTASFPRASSGGSGGGSGDGWTLSAKSTVDGDILGVTPAAAIGTAPDANHQLIAWEMEITDGDGTRQEQLRRGRYLNEERLIRVNGEATIRLRDIYKDVGTDNRSPLDGALSYSAWTSTKAATPGTGSVSVSISANFTSIVERQGVILKAEVTGSNELEPKLDVPIWWDFDDAGSYDNLPADMPWNDRSVAYGPTVGHTFDSAGTYTVTCYARVGGTTYSDTIDITVSAFAGTTVTIGTTGDYATFAAALTGTGTGSGDVAFLFQDDQTHIVDGERIDRTGMTILGRTGTGTNAPVIATDSGFGVFFKPWGHSGHLVVYGFESSSTFDPASNTSTSSGGNFISVQLSSAVPASITVSDCILSNFDITLDTSHTTPIENVVISNVVFDGWFNHAYNWQDGGEVVIEGCDMRQNPAVYTGGGYNGVAPDHGPIRISRATGDFAMQCCRISSLNSWGDGIQPGIRWASNRAQLDQTHVCNVERVVSEGGEFGANQHVVDYSPPYAHMIFDKVFHATTAQSSVAFRVQNPGTRLRNAVLMAPDAFFINGSIGFLGMLGVQPELDHSGALASELDLRFYNVTFVDMRNEEQSYQPQRNDYPGKTRGFNPLSRFNMASSLYSLDNTVAHCPSTVLDGTNTDTPLDTTGQWALDFSGYREVGMGFVPFTSGTTIPTGTITSASGASGDVSGFVITSGHWDTNDAEGWLFLTSMSGTFAASEALNDGAQFATTNGAQIDPNGTLTICASAGQDAILPRPQTGSAAIGDATTGLVAYHDFYGNVRGANPSRGAFEPA